MQRVVQKVNEKAKVGTAEVQEESRGGYFMEDSGIT